MKNFNLCIAAGLLLPCLAFADGMVGNPFDEHALDVEKARVTAAKPIKKGGESIAAEPMMPFADTRLVLFHYDPDLTYGAKTKEGLYTHIEIAKGDVIKGFYLSDPLRWKFHISGDKRRLFIKPSTSGQFTAATMVTEKRVYEMTFASVKGSEDWYQRVTWSYPSEEGGTSGVSDATGIFEEDLPDIPVAVSGVPGATSVRPGPQFDEPRPVGMVDPKNMSFNYTITGDAAFRPVTVFDDGRFTWLRFDKAMQDMPALFMLNAEGNAEVLNYTTHGDYILISRLTQGVLLRLGNQEVRVTKNKKYCGVFGC